MQPKIRLIIKKVAVKIDYQVFTAFVISPILVMGITQL